MEVRIMVETAFENGEKRIHQLDRISRPYRVTCPEVFGLRLEDGKRVVEQIQQAILCDQVEETTRESCVCPTCASVRAIHDYSTRVLDTLSGLIHCLGGFGSKPRACAAVLVMPGHRQAPKDIFLRSLAFFQTGLPRSCSGSLPSLGPGIPFAKPRG